MEPTEHGHTAFLQAAAVHSQAVERYFVKPLSRTDYTRLTSSLGAIHEALREG